ncbi:MAG: monovalent cation/H(+) antiporter subunit G [Microthrixaceae bacterium]
MRIIADVLICVGCFLVFLAALGLHRFSDLYTRIHSASKATSGGFVLVAAGAVIHLGSAAARVELTVAAVLLVITTPVGVHLLARAAHRRGNPRPENLSIDELSSAGPDPEVG